MRAMVERAFELARTGEYGTVTGILRRLKAEGYALAEIEGLSGKASTLALRREIKTARPAGQAQATERSVAG